MIKFCNLGSGSRGNATYFDVDGTKFLVDCGFTKIATKKRLAVIGKVIEDIERVFVTHDHKDHISPWIVKEGLVVDWPNSRLKCFKFIDRFKLSHDAECWGYVVTDKEGQKVAVISDTGCIPEEAIKHLFGCSAILIETNYDIDTLIDSPYTTETLERIGSELGHLRDACAIDLIQTIAGPELEFIVAIHLSSKNINPILLKHDLNNIKETPDNCKIVISSQDQPTCLMVII